MTEAARIIIGQSHFFSNQGQMSMLSGADALTHEPGSSHPEVRKQMGAVIENKIEHFTFTPNLKNRFFFQIKFGVKDVLLELWSR